jgi:hypothetical protein
MQAAKHGHETKKATRYQADGGAFIFHRRMCIGGTCQIHAKKNSKKIGPGGEWVGCGTGRICTVYEMYTGVNIWKGIEWVVEEKLCVCGLKWVFLGKTRGNGWDVEKFFSAGHGEK